MDSKLEFLTKELVEQAAKGIDEIGIPPGRSGKRYEVIINDKPYPFKLLATEAAKLAEVKLTPKEFYSNDNYRNTFKDLTGFECIKKIGKDPIADIISKYKKLIKKTRLKDEIYKWHNAKKYHGKPNVNALDFKAEISSIDFSNLIYGIGLGVIKHLTNDKPEEFREVFKVLLDESIELQERIITFNTETLKTYRTLVPNEKHSHHQDERTMGTYLALYDANTYPFFMDSFYQKFCKLLDVKSKQKNYKYVHYIELLQDLINDYILPDEELLRLKSEILDENCFEDKNHLILAQDILWQMLEQNKAFERKYWRVGTTEEGKSLWDVMLKSNHISIGWGGFGNFNEYNISKREDVLKVFSDHNYSEKNKSTTSRKAGELLDFYLNINVGDVILAQNGQKVLGVGIIKEGYHFDDSFYFSHYKPVEWKVINPLDFNNKIGLQTTVFPIKDYELITKIEALLENQSPMNYKNDKPLNQILYGPPGTGKTYHTINKAIEIINPKFNLELDRSEIKKEYDRLVKEGQIVFTTFHQSMSYEDFVEGIKPKINELESEDAILETDELKYEIKDGIFKQIVKKERENYVYSKEKHTYNLPLKALSKLDSISFGKIRFDKWEEGDELYDYCMENNCICIPYNNEINFESAKSEIDINKLFGDNSNQNSHEIIAIKSLKIWLQQGDWVFITEAGKNIVKSIAIIDGEYYYDDKTPVFSKHFRKVKWLLKDVNIPNDKIYTSRFSSYNTCLLYTKKVIKDFFKQDDENVFQNYVLIIDEINRGNVSSIFGELITLIENDKRLGENEALEVILPYSKEKFGVPTNLYIIGTMNTADRSVEALDTALRRRFSFEEMKPEPNIIKTKGKLSEHQGILKDDESEIDLPELLQIINERIEILLDRDHLIGHSYFMNVADLENLKEAFSKQIIPLLQEYFYGDYGKISLVIGEGFCKGKKVENVSGIFANAKDYEVETFSGKIIYTIYNPVAMTNPEFINAIKILLKESE